MALHEQSVGKTDEWFTPPSVFEALDTHFDMDVAHPGYDIVNWVPATWLLTKKEDGLVHPWTGFVWMNPPFGPRNGITPWLEKFVQHGNGIALTPDRTSAPWFQEFVWGVDLILFVSPKIRFIDRNGNPGKSPAQGTALCALGELGCQSLRNAQVNGLGIVLEPRCTVAKGAW